VSKDKDKAASAAAPAAAAKSSAQISSDAVRQLAEVLNDTGLSEIEYEAGGMRIRVARQAAGMIAGPAPVYMPAAGPVAAGGGEAAAAAKASDPANHPGTVKSPMVGVCYLSPEPGAANFIKVGDSVAEGQTIALIEAMKTFNPVKATRAGKVIRIIVDTGSPVEYGEPLIIIE